MKANNTLLFIVIVLLCLGGISVLFPKEGIAVGKRKLYFLTLGDLLSGDDRSVSALKRVEEIEESLRQQRYRDSIFSDSLAFYTHFFQEHPSRIALPGNNWDYFNDFFEEVEHCEKRNQIVRIIHYGDSQIESDRITGCIRQRLQEKFGGNGPGLLPAVQPIPSASVGQSASENIQRYIVSGMHQNRAPHKRYGVLGQVGMASGESRISINARNWKTTYDNAREFHKIRLFVGKSGNHFNARLTAVNKENVTETVKETQSPVKTYTWDLQTPVNKFTLSMFGAGEIYGIAVDGTAGVAVDNVPFRGSSGTFFNTMDSTIMTAMLQELNARLIILEFGGNAIPGIRGEKSIAHYRNRVSEQIAFLRRICPNAKILLIGPADMSTKVNGKLRSYPHLEATIEALKEAALSNGAAFWNMYEVMGGENSMIDWVKHSPSLAAPDYIHFTPKGAERIAGLFYESLMIYYDYYRFITENKPLRKNKKA